MTTIITTTTITPGAGNQLSSLFISAGLWTFIVHKLRLRQKLRAVTQTDISFLFLNHAELFVALFVLRMLKRQTDNNNKPERSDSSHLYVEIFAESGTSQGMKK